MKTHYTVRFQKYLPYKIFHLETGHLSHWTAPEYSVEVSAENVTDARLFATISQSGPICITEVMPIP